MAVADSQSNPQSDQVFEKYDLFNTETTAALYSKYQPALDQTVVDTVLEITPHQDLLIDIGCGSGSSTRPFAQHFTRVIGVDYSPAQIKLGKQLSENFDNVELHQGSLYTLPVPDNTVDCIVGVMIAQFIDLPAFFIEAKRVLKPGGVVLFHGKGSPIVIEIEGDGVKSSVEEINQRIVYIKTKLFKGLFHDRTKFNPLKYSNIPPLHPTKSDPSLSQTSPNSSCDNDGASSPTPNDSAHSSVHDVHNSSPEQCVRKEWTVSRWYTLPQLADYMLTWSAAGKYCALHHMSSEELKERSIDMLRCEDVGVERVRCQADRFLWYSRN